VIHAPFYTETDLRDVFIKLFAAFFLMTGIGTWWLVLTATSRRTAQQESERQTKLLLTEIDAHRQTDAELQRAKDRAEAASMAKSRFVTGMSHELRTPLNSILGYAQLLQQDGELGPERAHAIRVILRGGEHLLSLIEGTLDIARIEAGKALPLLEGVNPAWAGALATLHRDAVVPLFGAAKTSLTAAEWADLCGRLAAFEAWQGGKAGGAVEKLGLARVKEILAGNGRAALATLVAQDKALEPEFKAISDVERLVRYHRDLRALLHNFVNFADFYSRDRYAIFQAGTLYLDQRSCNLCITVVDPAKHAVMASLAGAYLAYVDCVRKATGQKLTVVAIFSQGDDENLMVGRNGVFYDRKGLDYDATITKIVANPISLRQAFWLPYKRFVRWVEEQIAKRAAEADAAASQKLAAVATSAASKTATPAGAAPQKVDVDTVAALGVAFGAIGGFFTAVATLGKDLWAQGAFAMVGAILGVMALISGPSLVMTYIKLRKRNLGPILDANGWAVNAKARINVPFGTRLTAIAELPPGAARDLVDPFEETRRPWKLYLALVVVALLGWQWWADKLDAHLPEPLRHSHHFPKKGAGAKADPATSETNLGPKAAPAP